MPTQTTRTQQQRHRDTVDELTLVLSRLRSALKHQQLGQGEELELASRLRDTIADVEGMRETAKAYSQIPY